MDSDEEMECEDADSMDELEEQDAEEEEEEAGGGAPPGAISIKDCLFCSHHSSSLMKNVAHMTKVHSFFIPDIEYLSDLKGLIEYLGKYNSFPFNEEIAHNWGAGLKETSVLCFSSIFDLIANTCLFCENQKFGACLFFVFF